MKRRGLGAQRDTKLRESEVKLRVLEGSSFLRRAAVGVEESRMASLEIGYA
jgi:hypothetical protein